MVVGEEDGPKALYIETSFDSLKKRAQFDENKMNISNKQAYFPMLENLNMKIKEGLLKRDQEMEYMMLFRFIQMYTKICVIDNKKLKMDLKKFCNLANKHMDRLEKLENILRDRYNNLKKGSAEQANLHIDQFFLKPIETVIKPPQQPIGTRNGFMECEELYFLLDSLQKNDRSGNKMSVLIIDCRAKVDFKASRIKYKEILSIPQSSIEAGKSASLLQYCINKDFTDMWKRRHSYDMVILVDRDSTQAKIEEDALLHVVILREILTEWDLKGSYKSLLVLDGGFEEFQTKYPHYTTNAMNKKDTHIPSPTNLLKRFKYPEVPDMGFEKPREPPKPVVPTVNRLIKPNLNFAALKEFNEETLKDKSKAGHERGEPSAPAVGSTKVADASNTQDPAPVHNNTGPAQMDSTIFPNPSHTLTDISNTERDKDETVDNTETVDENEVPQAMENRMSLEEKTAYVYNLRKVKPNTTFETPLAPSRPIIDDTSSSDEEVEKVPLKKDGGGSGMKRSLSSPNMAKVKDDDVVMTPVFSRSNKPSLSLRTQLTPSHLLGENPDAVYGRTQLGLTGLKNFANNCYMNSIVQCLSNTKPLVQELTNFNKKPPVNTNSTTKGQIANVFVSALHCIWSGDVRVYSIRELKNLMGNYKEIFKGSNHQDSHEFLIILLEYLHDDLNIPREVTVLNGAGEETGERAWGEFRKKNESVIQRLFYGQEQSSVTCAVCKHRSVTYDHFFNLSVPITDANRTTTLEMCIQEYLSGESIIWTCPKCKVDRNAIKKLDITRLPPILIIALKRFSHEVSWLEKKETLVKYPLENLDMRPLTLPGSEQRHTVYNLHALSTHTGTLRAGHYRAICQNHLTNKWYLFDDTSINYISAQEVRDNQEVYILFYHAVQ